MRKIDPFAFFYNHASAIRGLGGESRSPDPRYCFHTPYVEVRPGLAWFELHLEGVRASRGDLALRIHAFRPESGENASLAAAGRMNVWVEEKQDLNIKVRFGALRDVKYAFYGHFLEDGEIHADGVSVALVEPEGEEAIYIEPPRSELAMVQEKSEVRPANALIHADPIRLNVPVSQDYGRSQLDELGLSPVDVNARTNWSEALCLAAMKAYGVAGTGLEGQIVGRATPAFRQELLSAKLALRDMDEEPQACDEARFADFLLWPAGPVLNAEPYARWKLVRTWLARLKIGGLAVLHLRYHYEPGPLHAASAIDGKHLTRNEIGKWVLRLIGEGYSVAPMAFAPSSDLILDEDGLAAFNLIVRRA
jgi:hypothetical protein